VGWEERGLEQMHCRSGIVYFVCSCRCTFFINWKHLRLVKEEFRFGVRIAKFAILVRNPPPQNAPLTEQQQAAIVALSHAVAERPFPANLVIVPSLIMVWLAILLCELDSQVLCVFFRHKNEYPDKTLVCLLTPRM